MDNILESTNSLPDNTTTIDISNKQLVCLIDLPRFTTLLTLNCKYNNLQYLPSLNKTLTYLDCSGNQLKYLPSLNINLEYLHCYDNQLTHLPPLNEKLKNLIYLKLR